MRVMNRAQLDKQPDDVASMFDDVASRYDLTNDVLTFGFARSWRRTVADSVAAGPGERVLDLAAGPAPRR
jgi:demethylmenaquinone methyltransferase/2-methoxy-6-polyprenyl-1,4-benzoquinol methylase